MTQHSTAQSKEPKEIESKQITPKQIESKKIGYCNISHTLEDFCLDVQLHIPAQGITGIYGVSGSGKTALMRCIAGLEPLAKGEINLHGKYWQKSQEKIFIPSYKRSIAYVFQDARLFPHLNIMSNLHYGAKRHRNHQQKKSPFHAHITLEYVIELLSLEYLLNRKPAHLSGGEKQRVAIARALLQKPQLILMDEPLSALDHIRKQEVLPFLDKLHTHLAIPILYVSHNMQEITRLCDYLAVMDQGKILACDTLQKVITRLDIPLLGGHEASSVLIGNILDYDTADNLTRIQLSHGILYTVGKLAPSQKGVRIRIMAKDISLTLQPPKETSILNILKVNIDEYHTNKNGFYTVRLSCGNENLIAQISQRSWNNLKLKKNQHVFAQIKSIAIKGLT